MNNITFHPVLFESQQKDLPKNTKTLLNVTQERSKILNAEIKDLKSPGAYKFTQDDSAVSSGSNTRYLFKNLYTETPLTFLFFSEKNINNIQDLLRFNVYKMMNKVIDKQSPTELLIIMRSVFLEYHQHPPLFNPNMTQKQIDELKQMYITEVSRLNQLVLDTILPLTVSSLQQYLDYLRDISKNPEPIPRSIASSITGQREYRSVTQVLLGSNL